MMRYFTIILLVLMMVSCENMQLNEVIVEKYPDGTPKRAQYFSGEGEDQQLVKEIFYYDDGQKRVEGHFNDKGKKDGKWIYWYPDGKKWSEGYFSEGLNHKKRTTWHESGEKHYEGTYDMGKRIGLWKFYSDEGVLLKEIDYDKELED
jgi:antitoxin component YwqK of YwqJK toxin-antitoxin module